MNEQAIFDTVVTIIKPYVKNLDALPGVTMETSLLKDLQVNSARLVDVVLEIEDKFNIAITDSDADKIRTLGDAISVIASLVH